MMTAGGISPHNTGNSSTHSRLLLWAWLAFIVAAVVSVSFFFVPAFVIRPFRYQSPHALWIALALRQRAPVVTLFCGVVSLLFCFVLWRRSSIWRRSLLVLALLLTAFSAVMSRLNYFEWMFHPIEGARFLSPADAKVGSAELVMAIAEGGNARAYPISQMAYHHILNDVVGGVPVAVTY